MGGRVDKEVKLSAKLMPLNNSRAYNVQLYITFEGKIVSQVEVLFSLLQKLEGWNRQKFQVSHSNYDKLREFVDGVEKLEFSA